HRHAQNLCQEEDQAKEDQTRGQAPTCHGLIPIPRPRPAAVGRDCRFRPMVLYQLIIPAVRHITRIPARLTTSWKTIAESYSDRAKCPRAESRMPRQKISSDCWPQRMSGFAAAERRNLASGDTKAATTMTMAKKGNSRIGDRLVLLTGHNCLRKR